MPLVHTRESLHRSKTYRVHHDGKGDKLRKNGKAEGGSSQRAVRLLVEIGVSRFSGL